SDRVQVRDAARKSVVLYGPLAMSKLREGYGNLVGRPPPDEWDAERLARELFKPQDYSQLREVYAMFDDALAKGRDTSDPAALADAVHALDRVLARTPDLDRRTEAAPIYVRY